MAIDVQRVFDWLVDGAPGAHTPVDVVERLATDLVEAGVSLDRVAAFVRTLHPSVVGRAFYWKRGGAVEVREMPYSMLQTPAFEHSPVADVTRTGKPLRRRLYDPATPRDYEVLRELEAEGVTDYVALPMRFLDGQVHVLSFATCAPAGFTEDELAAVRQVVRPLSRIAEILALTRTATNLLNAYVGHDAGGRILAGKIQRGDTDALTAVLWFSDLRGFTALSTQLQPGEIIRVLNDLFDCQVPAIERHGGEVLKFMGDGLLAIFPVSGDERAFADGCEAALRAATEAFAELDRLNDRRASAQMAPIRFGLALHVGEVAYGNIGGSQRLDFTCIGPAVNLAARLEGLTARLGQPVIVSAEIARLTDRPTRSLGTFELKGVTEQVEVFVLG